MKSVVNFYLLCKAGACTSYSFPWSWLSFCLQENVSHPSYKYLPSDNNSEDITVTLTVYSENVHKFYLEISSRQMLGQHYKLHNST